jgi:hypothetical protein
MSVVSMNFIQFIVKLSYPPRFRTEFPPCSLRLADSARREDALAVAACPLTANAAQSPRLGIREGLRGSADKRRRR